jgi:C4-dicarboxylate transporter DctM subunit
MSENTSREPLVAEVGIVASVGLLVLIALGVPIGFALGFMGVFTAVVLLDAPLVEPVAIGFQALQGTTLVAIPLFILMSEIMIRAGINHDLFSVIEAWLGRLPGGMGVVAIATFGVFAALTGSSVATAMAIGSLTIPEMIKRGYTPRLAHGTAMASGTFGIMIPPSIPLIVYGVVTEDSIGRLFAAGIVPGILSALIYAAYVVWRSRRDGLVEARRRISMRERLEVTRRGIWGFLVIPVVLGGLYVGIFTPNEAAAAGVFASLLVAAFKKKVTFAALLDVGARSARVTSMIFIIIIGAKIFSHSLILARIPQAVADWTLALGLPFWLLLLSFSVLFFVLGLFFDIVPIVLMTMPIIHPILLELEVSSIWFAIFLIKNMEMANITPPVGLTMNVLKGHFNLTTVQATRAVAPFLVLDVFTLLIIILFPALTLWLPNLLYG